MPLPEGAEDYIPHKLRPVARKTTFIRIIDVVWAYIN